MCLLYTFCLSVHFNSMFQPIDIYNPFSYFSIVYCFLYSSNCVFRATVYFLIPCLIYCLLTHSPSVENFSQLIIPPMALTPPNTTRPLISSILVAYVIPLTLLYFLIITTFYKCLSTPTGVLPFRDKSALTIILCVQMSLRLS